jgi:pilus assembly protein Flp/PilA
MEGLRDKFRRFFVQDDGVAMVEYLMLLAILIGGALTAVAFTGDSLAAAYLRWADALPVPVYTP